MFWADPGPGLFSGFFSTCPKAGLVVVAKAAGLALGVDSIGRSDVTDIPHCNQQINKKIVVRTYITSK